MYRIATPTPALELALGLFVSTNRTVCGAAHPRRAASGPSNPSAVFALQPIPLPDPLPLQLNESKTRANTGWQKCRLAQIALGHHAMDRGAKSSGLPAASVSLAVAPCGQAVNRRGNERLLRGAWRRRWRMACCRERPRPLAVPPWSLLKVRLWAQEARPRVHLGLANSRRVARPVCGLRRAVCPNPLFHPSRPDSEQGLRTASG